ncbi:hypothetical protein AWJ20_4012 [Sugiyamaella lignohabitans]|uniref:Uncharacterized protein n=1 Tax=Sugiyamaella lignohabitans TaxID=796027 RepID=A0A167C4M2_9ASCO|nr:uncharacterized protein AWJ20_4012 [Sugiyamaella lignohabitans]ANB11210.1 hypothetical protein AWJ20_4012 [Sugiyamaella lignohabitans]
MDYNSQPAGGYPQPQTGVAGAGSNRSTAISHNGMPRSRHQQQLEDMLLSPGGGVDSHMDDMIQRPGSRANVNVNGPSNTGPGYLPRSASAMSFGRRISTSSVTSGSGRNSTANNAGFFGWGKKKFSNQDFDDDDDEGGTGAIGKAEDVPDISMNELTGLRDRDRYPTFGGAPGTPGGPTSPGTGVPSNGRTMSISSTMSGGGFDTTPVIPTLRMGSGTAGPQGTGQYRKNLTNSLKQAIRSSDGRLVGLSQSSPGQGPVPGPGYGLSGPNGMSGGNGYPMQQQRPYTQHQRPPSLQNSRPNSDPRLRSLTGPPNHDFIGPPHNGGSARTMSMGGGIGYFPPNANGIVGPSGPGAQGVIGGSPTMSGSQGFGPGPGPNVGLGQGAGRPTQRLSRPPSRLSQQHAPMVTASTMTDPIDLGDLPSLPREPGTNANKSSNSSTNSTDSTVDGTVTTATTMSSVTGSPIKAIPLSAGNNSADLNELRALNKALLDEVRLVTSELADSIRRELGLSTHEDDSSIDNVSISSSNGDNEIIEARQRAQKLVILERELDLERRKRMVAQQKHEVDEQHQLLTSNQYKIIELEKELAEKNRLYANERRESEMLRDNVSALTNEYEELQLETNQLKNGILPELKSHVADLEVLTAAGNPIELLKQIEELKVENKKLQGLVEENSMRGPLGEKIKAVESQRDALREALRSLKERNDHEIRQSTERVRQLEGKLEKEKVITNQMQRKLVQTRSPSAYVALNSPYEVPSSANNHHTLSTSSSSGSLNSGLNGSNNVDVGLASSTGLGQNTGGSGSTLSIPKRRGIGNLPGITPPAMSFSEMRPASPSPVNFEISQDPAWIDYVNPSKLPVSQAHARQFSSTSYSSQASNSPTSETASLFKTPTYRSNASNSPTTGLSASSLSISNGRTEHLPLSLAPAAATATTSS